MKRFSTILVLLSFVALTACEKTDTDLVLDFVNSWLEQRGVLSKNKDGGYSPTLKAVGVATGLTTTGDDRLDAAVQAGQVVKDLAENDTLVKEAEAAYAKNPPDIKTAEEKYAKAIDNRPDDWYYRNHRAYMYLDQGDPVRAKADLRAGIDGCAGNHVCLTALHRDRANFYASYQVNAFMAADVRMRTNCEAHRLGAESLQVLVNAGQTQHQGSLTTALNQQKEYCQ